MKNFKNANNETIKIGDILQEADGSGLYKVEAFGAEGIWVREMLVKDGVEVTISDDDFYMADHRLLLTPGEAAKMI